MRNWDIKVGRNLCYKVQKPCNSEYTPSSEPFTIYLMNRVIFIQIGRPQVTKFESQCCRAVNGNELHEAPPPSGVEWFEEAKQERVQICTVALVFGNCLHTERSGKQSDTRTAHARVLCVTSTCTNRCSQANEQDM
jgi:hypothetical protein